MYRCRLIRTRRPSLVRGVQRLPHRGAADLEPLCQLAFRGNLTAYRIFLTDNAFADIFCNLLVKCLCQGIILSENKVENMETPRSARFPG